MGADGSYTGGGDGLAEAEKDWLIGANGVYRGQPGGTWSHVGQYRYVVNQVVVTGEGTLVAACGNGLWEVPRNPDGMWIQLHDETLTEVQTIAETSVGIAAGSPYGVAISERDDVGDLRWGSLTEHLRVNARYTNTILLDPQDPSRWIVGTEGGVIIGEDNGAEWSESDLCDSPVRSVIHSDGSYWAASDMHGLMRSADGLGWSTVPDVDGPAFSVVASGGSLVVGTQDGVLVRQADGSVERRGPSILVRCLAIDPGDPDVWVAGADPGGLWISRDAGMSWKNTGFVTRVRTIVAPSGGVS
jgi:hypothetical protein